MSLIDSRPRARDPRFARQPDRRGRRHADRRRGRPRRRPVGRLHRRARGRRAARRRQEALPRQGRLEGRRERQRHDRAASSMASTRSTRRQIDATMIELDGTPNKVEARRQRDPRRLAGHGARGRRRARSCRSTATSAAPNARTLPVPMMNILNGGAHADNNVDFQEFMVDARRRARPSPKRCAWAPRSSTR